MQFFVRYGKIVGNNVCRLNREAQIFLYLGRGRNMQRDGTLGYYDDHAEEFYKGTVNVAFAAMQERFLEKLEKGAYIRISAAVPGGIRSIFWNGDTGWRRRTALRGCVSWRRNIPGLK